MFPCPHSQVGMEVTFHEKGINAFGWSGVGYSIINPDTGAGSYLIEGKGNGAILILFLSAIAIVFALFLFTVGWVFAGILLFSAGLIGMVLSILDLHIQKIIDLNDLPKYLGKALSTLRALGPIINRILAALSITALGAVAFPAGVVMEVIVLIASIYSWLT